MGLKDSLHRMRKMLPSIDDGEDSLYRTYAHLEDSGQYPLYHLWSPNFPGEDREDDGGKPLPEPLERLYCSRWAKFGYGRGPFLRWLLVNADPKSHTRLTTDYFRRQGKSNDKYLRWAEKVHYNPRTFMYLTEKDTEEWWHFADGDSSKAFSWLRWDFNVSEAQDYWASGIAEGYMAYLFKESSISPERYASMWERHGGRLLPGRIYELEVSDLGGAW